MVLFYFFLVMAAVFGFFTLAAFGIFKTFEFIHNFLFEATIYFAPSKDNIWIPILTKEFAYYNKLPDKSKTLFLKKMNYFYRGKNFIPKSGLVLDERKKALICASAAQLTFGLPLLQLPHFKDILIYPSTYYNKRTNRNHVGEVNTQGLIVFSWEHIQKGLDNPTDGYNVALHELAHALRFEDYFPNEERHFLHQKDINELHRIFDETKNLSLLGVSSFLNNYSLTNFEEFFAVSVESFFERPLLFEEKMPRLYHCMCHILNQDTALLEKMNKNL